MKNLYKIAQKQALEHGIINLSIDSICEEATIAPGDWSEHSQQTFYEMVQELAQEGYPVKPVRERPELRKQAILTKLLVKAHIMPYPLLTRAQAADYVGVSPALISYYFTNTQGMRDAIIKEALRVQDTIIITQGKAMKDPIALEEVRDAL